MAFCIPCTYNNWIQSAFISRYKTLINNDNFAVLDSISESCETSLCNTVQRPCLRAGLDGGNKMISLWSTPLSASVAVIQFNVLA